MSDLKLVKAMVDNAEFINEISSGDSLKLEIKMEFKADGTKDKGKCIGRLKLHLQPDKNESSYEGKFEINVSLKGYFMSSEELNINDELASEVYQKLFPHMQSYVSSLTALSGVPSIVIPEPPISEIYKKGK